MNETTVLISGRWLSETEKAVRFRVDKIGQRDMVDRLPYWFPLSQVTSMMKNPLTAEDYANKLDTLKVKEWLIIKNGLYEKLKPAGAVPISQEDSNVYGSRLPEAYDDYDDDIPF